MIALTSFFEKTEKGKMNTLLSCVLLLLFTQVLALPLSNNDGFKMFSQSPAAADFFGWAIATLADGYVVVGAPTKTVGEVEAQGEVFLYSCVQLRSCQFIQRLMALDGRSYQQFGASVAVSTDGTAIVVGANGRDSAAYVFACRNPITFCNQQSKLLGDDTKRTDNFGGSVAVSADGGVVFVGASHQNNFSGVVYIFTCSRPSQCSQTGKLTPAAPKQNDQFGHALSLSPSLLLISAYGKGDDQGVVYVFKCTGALCFQSEMLAAPDGQPGDRFGYSVAVFENYVAIGADGKEVNGNKEQGVAYFFDCSKIACVSGVRLAATTGREGDHFGRSVAIMNKYIQIDVQADDGESKDGQSVSIAVGAPNRFLYYINQGMVYIYSCSLVKANDCHFSSKVVHNDSNQDDKFGSVVAFAPAIPQIYVGSHFVDVEGLQDSGVVVVFESMAAF